MAPSFSDTMLDEAKIAVLIFDSALLLSGFVGSK